MAQLALHHGPGRYRALFTFKGEALAARSVAQELLLHMENVSARPLYVLVALGTRALTDEQRAQLHIEPAAESSLDLLIQIAADGADDMTFALRLVRFVLSYAGNDLKVVDQLSGTRRILDRENFGLKEAAPDVNKYGLGAKSEGEARWLLFQRCEQDLVAFDKQAPNGGTVALAAHKNTMLQVELAAGGETALRRSFAYEDLGSSGLAFVATSATPNILQDLLRQFQADVDAIAKSTATRGQRASFFIVPSNTQYFGKNDQPKQALPHWVTAFLRKIPIVQYDVTVKMDEFLHQAFHVQGRKIRLDPAQPREDVQLLTESIVKLVLGYAIKAGSLQEEFLQRLANRPVAAKSASTVKGAPASAVAAPTALIASGGAALVAEIDQSARRAGIDEAELGRLAGIAKEAEQQSYDAFLEAGGEYVTFSL